MSHPAPSQSDDAKDASILNEIQLPLAEKRAHLSTLSTVIAMFIFSLSVLSVLIATSRQYQMQEMMQWIIPLPLLNLGLIALAVDLVARTFVEYKRKHSRLAHLLG